MAGKAYFVCRGKEKNHVLLYDLPDGVSIESFAENTPCRECGAKIDYQAEM